MLRTGMDRDGDTIRAGLETGICLGRCAARSWEILRRRGETASVSCPVGSMPGVFNIRLHPR
jgi:hypothetical protein